MPQPFGSEDEIYNCYMCFFWSNLLLNAMHERWKTFPLGETANGKGKHPSKRLFEIICISDLVFLVSIELIIYNLELVKKNCLKSMK